MQEFKVAKRYSDKQKKAYIDIDETICFYSDVRRYDLAEPDYKNISKINRLLIRNLPKIIESNPSSEVYLVPRVNTVKGILDEHVQKWGWKLNERKWVNWPDYQWRIWKNKPEIKWKNKVHEVLEGHKRFAALPPMEDLALYHHKTIERQRQQNKFYEGLL